MKGDNLGFLGTLGILSFGVLGGCSFKAPSAESGAAESASGTQVSVDWSTTQISGGAVRLKAIRTLRADSTGWSTSIPVSIPAQAPEILTLSISLPANSLSEGVTFVRAGVKSSSQFLALSPLLLRSGSSETGMHQISIQVSGVNIAFSAERSNSGDLEVELFGATRRLSQITIQLRTPPSEVAVVERSLAEWSALASTIGDALKRPVIQGQQLSLVRVIELTNHENTPIVASLPRRLGGSLAQWTNVRTYQDLGCSGAGFAVNSSPAWQPLSNDLVLLPLDETLISSAQELLGAPSLRGKLELEVSANETKRVAVYALGTAAARWSSLGPESSTLQSISVPSSCYQVCTQRECDCTVHCNTRAMDFMEGILRPTEPTPLGCTCSAYEDRRHSVGITVGVERSTVALRIPADSTVMSLRYGDLDSHQDGEVRALAYTAEETDIQWQ